MSLRCLFLICACAMLITCTSKNRKSPNVNSTYPYKINLEKGLENRSKIYLSEIADSIVYDILLDKTNFPLDHIYPLETDDENIFIQTVPLLFMRLDKKCRYLNNISSRGRGPGEYISASFSVDFVNKKVLLLRNFSFDFLEFDYNGKFVRQLPFKVRETVFRFSCIETNRILVFPSYTEVPGRLSFDEMFLCELYTRDGDLIQRVKHPMQYKKGLKPDRNTGSAFIFPTFFYGEAIISGFGLDTIYKTSGDSIYQAFIYNRGKYTPTYMQRFSYLKPGESKDFLKDHGKIFETPSKAYTIFSLEDKNILFEYNKLTGDIRSMEISSSEERYDLGSTGTGFINDIDGGINFYPLWTDRTGFVWLSYCNALDFKEKIRNNLNNKKAVNKKTENKLLNFVDSLNIEDNPILIRVYLKK